MIRNAFSVRKKLRMLVYGEPFTGKSTLAMQFAYLKRPDGTDFRVLYIDTEGGSVDHYVDDLLDNGVKPENFLIVPTQSMLEVQDYIKIITNNEDFLDDDGEVIMDAYGKPFRCDALVIDSVSILALTAKQGLINFSQKRARVKAEAAGLIGEAKAVKIEGAGMELKDYNALNYRGQSLILDLNASGVNYMVTCREKNETVSVKDDKGAISSVATGRKLPDGFKGQDYNVDTEFRLYRNPEDNSVVMAYFDKDRTGLHKDCEIVENLSLVEYQDVLDRSAKHKEVILKNGLDEAVKTEVKLTMRELGLNDSESEEETAAKDTGKTAANDIEALRAEVKKVVSGLTNPVKKAEVQKKIKEAGLPIAFTKITDYETLSKVYEILKKEAA